MKKPVIWLSVAASLSLNACTYVFNNLPGVYKIDIGQGNIIDQNMVNQLRPNMTKRQVQYIMGSPLLIDTFHQERWDYVYSNAPGGEDREQKRVALFFTGEYLSAIQGDFHPGGDAGPVQPTESSIDLPKREMDKSMWEKVSGLFGG